MAAQESLEPTDCLARPEKVQLEKQISGVRAGGVAFGAVSALTAPDSTAMGIAWVFTAVLALSTLSEWRVVRSGPTARDLARAGMVAFGVDSALIGLSVFTSITDPGLHGYQMLMIPLLEASVRWGLRGSLLTLPATAAALLWHSLEVADRTGDPVTAAHLFLRVFVMAILAISMGLTVDKLNRATLTIRRTLDATQDIIIAGEISTLRILSVNPAVRSILGHEPAELVGQDSSAFFDPAEVAAALPVGGPTVGIQRFELRSWHVDGTEVWLEVSLTLAPAEDRWFAAARDTTERRRLQQALAHQAFHDALTGLPNRAKLYQRLTELLPGPHLPALLYIDLDGFKPVNDELGHQRGDELLTKVGRRLQAEVRDGDLVARLGGDEFCILLSGPVPPGTVDRLVGRVQHSLSQPFELNGAQAAISASVGIAYAVTGDDGTALLGRADADMYSRKRGRRPFDPPEAAAHRAEGVAHHHA